MAMFSSRTTEGLLQESFTNTQVDTSSENLRKGRGPLAVPTDADIYFVTCGEGATHLDKRCKASVEGYLPLPIR